MRSNYKRLGDYIERCDEFNEGMAVQELLGISNNKYFQKSHTNTIGIDLTKYRIVRSNQFAFNRATTRNGDKISIALRKGDDCMVSPSYRIFKSKDEQALNSEYLMMWFNRPEFDRYARFKSHGSAHEFFDWEEMCEVELPIPSPEKQLEIVREYNV
ncbi:MAG: restriction endonuclease subunit S, partial [Flavobacterium sp.]